MAGGSLGGILDDLPEGIRKERRWLSVVLEGSLRVVSQGRPLQVSRTALVGRRAAVSGLRGGDLSPET